MSALLSSKDCWDKFGDPTKEKGMVLWNVPENLRKGRIPLRIYCNKLMVEPLTKAFENLIKTNYVDELKTFDGCFCIRKKRGNSSMSIHAWGLAIDVNASTNQFGKKPTLSAGFVKCFTDAGFVWGGNWEKPDGMHLQLREISK